MRKILSVLLSIVAVFIMCSCTLVSASAPGTEYGSFTIERTSSYDGKYYAYMTQHDQMIVVNIYSEDDNEVFTFEPCRKRNHIGQANPRFKRLFIFTRKRTIHIREIAFPYDAFGR